MYALTPTRLATMLVLISGLCGSTAVCAQRRGAMAPPRAAWMLHSAQQGRRMAPAPSPARRPNGYGAGNAANASRAPKGEHLAEWMNQHRNLTPAQQQQALQNEPGFRELPPQTQQRMRERLNQLDGMNPDQRARLLQRNERMEQLNPEQRGEVRGAMQQLGSLPPDQRRVVARSFRELRDLPPNQRMAAMSHIPLNDAQRSTLSNLIRIEPMLPPPEPR